jgi:signal transduction histidine kinase
MKVDRLPPLFRPNRLAVQITLLILFSIVIFQSLMIVLFHVLDVEGRRHIVDQRDFVAEVILALDAAPVPERGALVTDLLRATPYVNVTLTEQRPGPARSAGDDDPDNERNQVISLLWQGADAFKAPDTANGVEDGIAVKLRKGGYALVSIAQHEKPPRSVWRWLWEDEPGEPFILTPWARAAFAFFMFATIFVFWTTNAIMAPLKRLAKHAEGFPGKAKSRTPLAEQGPSEVRELTRAINRMEERIHKMIAERAHVLAAVSHDLRTIITRMKLKTDFVADAQLQEKLLRDIHMMDAMLLKNLHYLKAEQDDRADYSQIDLDSVLQTVANAFCDMGHVVSYSGGQHETVFGSLSDVQRIFTNLVENAVHYGAHVNITIEQLPDKRIQVEVADDGPGMSDAEKTTAFDPFVRGQPGRTVETRSGFGLGLSIVQSLVTHHGGSVTLHDRAPHGLIARVRLPDAASIQRDSLTREFVI